MWWRRRLYKTMGKGFWMKLAALAVLSAATLLLAACAGEFSDEQSSPTVETPAPTAVPAEPKTEDPLEQYLAAMTLDEKIGQLFLVRPDALDPAQTREQINDAKALGLTQITQEVCRSLQQYPVGGVALFAKNITDAQQLKALIADLQAASGIPLFVAVDEEGGAVARLANHKAFAGLPTYQSAAAVGAQGTQAALEMGQSIGAYLRQYGFTMDFAPVADVNTNPQNPVIGARAFSGDAQQAKALAAAMAQGLQQQGILPTFKHFPGHGDTAEDSHYGLATLHKSYEQLAGCEWVPYGYNESPPLPAGSYAVMVGHIAVPAVTGDDTPASLSYALVTGVLKEQLYDPLIITDSLAMQGITDQYSPGQAAVLALQAGCDVLLMPDDLPEAFDAVRTAVQNGSFLQQRLDESVRKILQYKMQYGMLTV